jgi:hypothetical protein
MLLCDEEESPGLPLWRGNEGEDYRFTKKLITSSTVSRLFSARILFGPPKPIDVILNSELSLTIFTEIVSI